MANNRWRRIKRLKQKEVDYQLNIKAFDNLRNAGRLAQEFGMAFSRAIRNAYKKND